MIAEDNADRMLARLASLDVLRPDPVHAESVRARCREELARRERNTANSTARRRSVARLLEAALVAALSGGYLFGIIQEVIRLSAAR